jgi:predicted N-formylglutamate amidohydrolase
MPDTNRTRHPQGPRTGSGSTAPSLMITCEHGGNRIPPAFRALFSHQRDVLASHRGFDAGALLMANALAAAFRAPLLFSTTSRLLVDLNRTAGHPRLHAELIRRLPAVERTAIIERHHQPYHADAERLAARAIAVNGMVIHVSCHSFTPVLNGAVRAADVGLLYDPASPAEAAFCARWKAALQHCAPGLKVLRNSPYRGKDNGLTCWLRKQFSDGGYIGIELEINQRHILGDDAGWSLLRRALVTSLQHALETTAPGPCRSVQAVRRIGPTSHKARTGDMQ